MARPPYYRPLEPSGQFVETVQAGSSARPLVEGTVALGQPLVEDPLGTWLKEGQRSKAENDRGLARPDDYVDTFPFLIDEQALARGQERYTIFCAVCHSPTGNGGGKIVERGYVRPPNYHTDPSRGLTRRWRDEIERGEIPREKVLLPDVPVGYYYEVITLGYGAMPDYASQVPPRDRWKIIAYIRALQLSQHAELKSLPQPDQEAARKALEKAAQPAGEGQR